VRAIRTGIVATALLAALGAALYGILDLGLPKPAATDRLGARILATLERLHGAGGRGRLNNSAFAARCHRLLGGRSIIELADGERVLLHVDHVRLLAHGPSAGRSAIGPAFRAPGRQVLVADAELAGSMRLYGIELTDRLLAGRLSISPVARRGHEPAYWVTLSREPRVQLLVRHDSLVPVEVLVRSPLANGRSRLEISRSGRRGC
jgi:hypothetical protein